MKKTKKSLIKNKELKYKISHILRFSEMWTYVMDSYDFPESKKAEKILEKDFNEMIEKIIKCVIDFYEQLEKE